MSRLARAKQNTELIDKFSTKPRAQLQSLPMTTPGPILGRNRNVIKEK